ncbi:hypothetical protein J2799_000889 [Chryseobacterium vietnamense]|uniref:hypothetical protein n=1 Tax=Chryseobacterium vietnamense TaxID=866785 RepID=UPI00285FBF85|nr:hypothetical protein [Chryseobacterium vietnamense]MDR6486404.1 hypothetical protein [Chryseobacterium vietnamense]
MKHLFTFLLILSGSLAFGQKVSSENISMLPPIHQLRIYEIPKENKLVFLDRFRDHAQNNEEIWIYHCSDLGIGI